MNSSSPLISDMGLTFLGGGSSRSHVMQNRLSVNAEYMETFRTNSYTEIWSKVQEQLRRTSEERVLSSSLSPFPSYTHLSDFLLEPPQEILIDMIDNSDVHQLLMDYFEGSLEACKICGFLLQSIDQTRANHCIIQRVINLSKRVSNVNNHADDQCRRSMFNELASFTKLDNPLSSSSPFQFSIIHDRYRLMLDRLTLKHKKIVRRAKLIGLCKKALGVSLILTCGALAIVTLVLAIHSMVGIVAAPGLVTFPLAFLKRRIKSARVGLKTSTLMRFGAQLDAAAKGVYILNKDFDTMSRLVVRLHNEIEHSKAIAGLCLRSQKRQMLKEVVNEFQNHESCFLEQLEELEEHVYLCFLTINRARRLVIQEIMVHKQQRS